jgi:hypothetical protein
MWALQSWLGILPLLCIAAIICYSLQVLKYLLTYKIWHVKCAKWRDHKILPQPSTCTSIYGTPFECQLEVNTLWSTLILIKMCGNKIRFKMKTNGYLIFNSSSLDVYEPQCSGFWPFVITHFNAAVLTFCGWFELNGITPQGNLASRTCRYVVYVTKGYVIRTALGSKVPL